MVKLRQFMLGMLLIMVSTAISNANNNPVSFKTIAAGNGHTCGLDQAGIAFCWGANTYGKLGNHSLQDSNVPVAVAAPTGGKTLSFSSLALGGLHTCGLTSTGGAYCWGHNYFGELGNQDTNDSAVPVVVESPQLGSLLRIKQLTAGYNHTCGLDLTGIAYCWGENDHGQLGNHSIANSSTAVAVVAPSGGQVLQFSSIVVGTWHTCGLSMSGNAYCWGLNDDGELGNHSTTSSSLPVAVAATSDGKVLQFSEIAAGDQHSCGLTANGNAYCWGYNFHGELGNQRTNNSNIPVAVQSSSAGGTLKFSQLEVGGLHTCGLTISGKAYCWGNNQYGELGNHSTNKSDIPIAVMALQAGKVLKFSSIALGDWHSCGLDSSGQVYCWGSNAYGELGNHSNLDSSLPVPMTPTATNTRRVPVVSSPKVINPRFSSITAGAEHSCALTTNGQAYFWGNNQYGQLGDNSLQNSGTPVAVVAAADGSSLRFSSLSAGGFHTCGVTTDGSAYCWGDNSLGALGISPLQDVSRVPVAVGSRLGGQALRFSSLSAGFAYTCGLTPQGQAYCWGFNEYGELGNHAAYTSNDPVAVVAPAKGQALRFQSIAAGEDHTCALTLNAIAYCWGHNEFGKLGNHSTTNSSLPVAVSAANRGQILRFSKLVVGDRHTCGLSSNGGAYCWGYNFPGSLGNNSTTNSSIPVAVVAAKGGNILSFSSITAGGAQTCGLTTNGSAFCWGWNRTGQLGDHTNTMSSVPVPVAAPTGEPTLNFLSLAAGSSHTCGIAVSGKAYCWGENNRAQLGNSNPKNVNIPTAVMAPKIPNLPVFSSFTVGLEHLCGLTAQGTAYCWGQNNYGQLGNSTVTASNSPVAVAAPRGEPTLSFSSLTAGAYHTCGLISKGKAYCWGAGGHGALGNAADRNSSIPVVVLSPTQNALPFTSLSAGYGFSCGITLVGSAYCWGDNAFGKLGTTSTTYTLVATPVASPNGGTPLVFQHISTGYDHACGLASNGAAYCWGLNRDGGLGDGSTSDSSLPVAVVAPTGEARLKFSSISAGAGLSCGLTVTGAAYCWGDNTFGALGNGSTISSSLPVRVAVPRGIKSLSFLSISTGANHSCALTSSGKAYCWGWNKFGALGNGNTTNSSIPVPVKTLGSESGSSLLKLIASGFRTCGLSVRGKIRCW